MSNTWGRPPRKEFWQDLQALALWILIIGVVGYVLFPNFFKGIYSRLSDPVSQASTLNTDYELNNLDNTNINAGSNDPQTYLGQDFSSVSNALYNSGKNEISSGYWVIYVADGEFKQLSLISDTYEFLLKTMESDKNAVGNSTVILASNGQIHKYIVSDEIYAIIKNMNLIDARSKQ